MDLLMQCGLMGLQEPEPEFRFHATRKWRVDYAWPERKIAFEVEGGIWIKGRHTSPKGFLRDLAKYNALSLAGWRLFRVTPEMVASGEAVELVRQALTGATS